MCLLILTQYYIPEPQTKMHVLAKDLIKKGHNIEILTTFPNYPEGKIHSNYRQRFFQIENIDGIKIIRVPIYPYKGKSALKMVLHYLSFLSWHLYHIYFCAENLI